MWNGNVYVGFTNGQMYALDQNTGATKWSYQAGGALYLGGAAVANGLLFFGAGNGVFYALNATTGALVWKNGFRRVTREHVAVCLQRRGVRWQR